LKVWGKLALSSVGSGLERKDFAKETRGKRWREVL